MESIPNRKDMDPRDRWALSGEHYIRSDRMLAPAIRAPRTWTCTCGFTVTGFDNAAKLAFKAHTEA